MHFICSWNMINAVLMRNTSCENYMRALFLSVIQTSVATHLGNGIILWARSFTRLPGGNMVDGLPAVSSLELM